MLRRSDNLVQIREGEVGLAPGFNTHTAQVGGPVKLQSEAGPKGVVHRVRQGILDRPGASWVLR